MRSCIHHTVVGIVVGKIITLFPGIKSKLQHLHARITALFQQVTDTVRNSSQILRDNLDVLYILLDAFIRSMPGPGIQFPFLAVFSPKGIA